MKRQNNSSVTSQSQSHHSDSPAKTSVSQDMERVCMDPGLVFSSDVGNSLCWLDLSTYSWRTYQLSLLRNTEIFSGRWPKAGTLLNGHVYRQFPVELGTEETDGGQSHTATTLPGQMSLTSLGKLWPTPRASENDQGRKADRMADGLSSWKAQGRGATLTTAVKQDARRSEKLWPTICASQYRGSGPLGSKSHQHRLDRGYLDATVIQEEQKSGKLNPDWVELLMGYPVGYTLAEGEPDHSLVDPQSWLDGSWEDDVPRLTPKNINRAKRLKALGNSVVPQVVEQLGQFVAQHYKKTTEKK